MDLHTLISLAHEHVAAHPANEDSARLCLKDAYLQNFHNHPEAARQWAVKSLAYSLGILHPIYQAATK